MGKYLNMLREEGPSRETSDSGKKRVQTQGVDDVGSLKPGVRITWPGNTVPTILDCLHTEPDGSVWAFVTFPDGWAAINAKFVTAV